MYGSEMTSNNFETGANALHTAVSKQNHSVVETLISLSFPMNELKHNGITALGIAALKGDLRMLAALHLAGGDINLTSDKGIGPLYLSIKAKSKICSQYLIKNDAALHYDSMPE